jgi:hypothetical protein
MANYKSFRNLPTLAGISTIEEAMKSGLSVEQCVTRLKRFHYTLKRLHQIFNNRITAEPIYELKMGYSLHAHYCAEHVTALRKRVSEMREPPLGLDETPHPALEALFDEILCSPSSEELVFGIYGKALPALKAAMEGHIRDTNPLADHPSIRVCRFALLEINEMLNYGAEVLASIFNEDWQKRVSHWSALLDDCLAACGGLDGISAESGRAITRLHSAKPYRYDPVPRRDERFPDPYNMGVNAEVFLYDAQFPPQPKTLMMFYKRLREIDVPEMMASIIAETSNKPWDYYRDMTRQLWDEARHAMMGEVGFAQLGINWSKYVMVNFTWALSLNTQLKPIERHAVLYFIEQGLMPRNGKRFEWEVGQQSGNPLSALFQDYDWADEVLHAKVGRDWYLKEFSDARKAVQYGDECWSKVLMNWENWRKEGKTEHRNWWPELYQQACNHWGIQPEPKVLGYATTYESVRADLKEVTGSA